MPTISWLQKTLGPSPVADSVKATLTQLSTYGDYATGKGCRPGLEKLAEARCLDERTIRRHLEIGVAAGLIYQRSRGRKQGNTGVASIYWLTIPNRTFDYSQPDTLDVHLPLSKESSAIAPAPEGARRRSAALTAEQIAEADAETERLAEWQRKEDEQDAQRQARYEAIAGQQYRVTRQRGKDQVLRQMVRDNQVVRLELLGRRSYRVHYGNQTEHLMYLDVSRAIECGAWEIIGQDQDQHVSSVDPRKGSAAA